MKEKEKQLQKDYHITDEQLQRIHRVMEKARKAIKEGKEYNHINFERAILGIVQAPEGYPEYDYHMATAVARAFAEDGDWYEVYITLYKDVNSERTAVENLRKKLLKK